MLTQDNNIKAKSEMDGKINIYSCCIDSGFEKFCHY